MSLPANWPRDRSHNVGLGSLSGLPPQKQPDGDHDVQGRPTPRAFASDSDTPQTSATEISYPAEGKVRFAYEGNDITPKKAASDARNWAAREFFRQFETGKSYDEVLKRTLILGVHVIPGKIVVTVSVPSEKEFRNKTQRFPSSVNYTTGQ